MVSFLTKSRVPQGSVLSQLLFLIYFNDLTKPHNRQNSKSQFADDTALWAASKNIQFAAKPLRKNLRKLAKWGAKWRIELNLKLYGDKLEIYPQVKFLGITFDFRFPFQNTLRKSWGAATPATTDLDFQLTKNWDPARPPYYKFTNNVSVQFSNMALFRP